MSSVWEVRRLTAADAELMQDIIPMLPVPDWRDERVPGLRHLESALADRGDLRVRRIRRQAPGRLRVGLSLSVADQGVRCRLYLRCVRGSPDRRRGIGRKLTDPVLAECRRESVAEAWVGADLDNPPAHRLFVGLGAKSHAEYIQFEFDFAPSREKES